MGVLLKAVRLSGSRYWHIRGMPKVTLFVSRRVRKDVHASWWLSIQLPDGLSAYPNLSRSEVRKFLPHVIKRRRPVRRAA